MGRFGLVSHLPHALGQHVAKAALAAAPADTSATAPAAAVTAAAAAAPRGRGRLDEPQKAGLVIAAGKVEAPQKAEKAQQAERRRHKAPHPNLATLCQRRAHLGSKRQKGNERRVGGWANAD